MLTTLRDTCDQLQAVCEWHLVNHDGQQDTQGQWVWLQQLELSPGMKLEAFVRWLIQDVARRCPTAQWAYWQRRLKTGDRFHCFSKRALITYSLHQAATHQPQFEEVRV